MMGLAMKSVAFLLCCIASSAALAAQPAQLSKIHSVYLLPMANGLDQYLANRLTNAHVFQVVTDPKNADAVFTDQLGEAFEARFDELYAQPAAAQRTEEAKEAESDEKKGNFGEERPVRFSTFQRGRGNIFLVDTKTRAVIWSTYEKPKNYSPEQLDRAAQRIADRLNRGLGGK
jgi:hypothetical protein